MSKVLIAESILIEIGNAIRTKLGVATMYKPSQMATAIVSISNTYSAGDEGKVVSGGALVSQTSATKTANGTYTTTTNNEIVVAIPLANGEDF